MNSVDSQIKRKSFSPITLDEKIQIKTLGRPMPDLNIVQTARKSKDRTCNRHFNKEVYYEHSCICGCEGINSLFCFPCLLYGGQDFWSKSGVNFLGHQNRYIKKHSESKKHLNNVLDLNALGNVDIAVQLIRAYQDSVQMHNEQVEKNRYILSKIIDCIKFCGAFEEALRGHDECEQSENPVIFRGLIDFVSNKDDAMKEHIQNSAIFKGTSKTIQNELLDCMLKVGQEMIKKEMTESKFVAVMAMKLQTYQTSFS
jgi:hypothetical protein